MCKLKLAYAIKNQYTQIHFGQVYPENPGDTQRYCTDLWPVL